MKKTMLIAAAVLAIAGCKQREHGSFVVQGKVSHAPEASKVILQEIPYGGENPLNIDSTTLKKDGSFTLRGMALEEKIYRVIIGNSSLFVVNDDNDIRITLDMDQFRQYKVEGSPASAEMHDLLDTYSRKDSALYVTFMQLDSLQKNKASDSVLNIVRQQRDQQINEMNAYVKGFINKSNSPANRFFAIGNFALRSMPMNESKELAEASAAKFKEHSGLAKLKSLFAVQAAQQPAAHPLLNKQAPEISMPDITGNTFNLSSLRGKYVLVDFWASWCKPCREENPNVVAAYNQFKDKNFTILGVSLDSDKGSWVKAIQKDGLTWTHISDLKMWETSVVNTYQFEGIPFNVLIDPQGKVIATNLRGPALTQQLSQILK
ncbi:MAG: hypothetical protein RIR90_1535 [Bacteroidota bacterium]|jgi:peroxiredoxin